MSDMYELLGKNAGLHYEMDKAASESESTRVDQLPKKWRERADYENREAFRTIREGVEFQLHCSRAATYIRCADELEACLGVQAQPQPTKADLLNAVAGEFSRHNERCMLQVCVDDQDERVSPQGCGVHIAHAVVAALGVASPNEETK